MEAMVQLEVLDHQVNLFSNSPSQVSAKQMPWKEGTQRDALTCSDISIAISIFSWRQDESLSMNQETNLLQIC